MMSASLGRHHSVSTGSRSSQQSGRHLPSNRPESPAYRLLQDDATAAALEPCAATAAFFLYTFRNYVICVHHDTLIAQLRFEGHKKAVSLLSVDNVSDKGAGRLVVSYDVGRMAVVWDVLTGDQVARFESYEDIRVAAWMRNGTVAFGTPSSVDVRFGRLLTRERQLAGQYHPVRAIHLRAHLHKDHIRSDHGFGAFG